MISRVLIKNQPGRRWLKYAAGLSLLALTLGVAGSALAVHGDRFQLDGDTTNTAYSPPPNTNPAYDWNAIFNVSEDNTAHTEAVAVNGSNVGSGKVFDAANFVRDFESGGSCTLISNQTPFCTADDTTYATGSKDTLGIANGGWQCNHDANVNSKIDIMNAYVLAWTNPANGHKVFYFGMEKNKTNGTNDVGFWFLQGGADCSVVSGHKNFTGGHLDGDTLVVSEYTNGGGVSTVKAFRWAAASTGPLSGDGGCIDSHDNPDPNAYSPGVTPKERGCNNKPIATSGDCKLAGASDALCATTNAFSTDPNSPASKPWNQNVTTPWLTSDATLGVQNTVVSPDFFEGGIDITAAFTGQGGTTPSCFTTIVPDTRSAASATATLFDFTLNQIGKCQSGLTTTKNAAASTPIGTDGTVSSGTDTAELKISGTANWGGTLKFYLCGPDVSLCDTGGYLVTTKTVANTDNSNCGADCTYTSGSVNLTSAGTSSGQYCWHARFVPDAPTAAAGVKIADDDGTGECFVITPLTPTLTTSASGPVELGQAISDTASLTGTANNPKNDGTNLTYPSIGGTTKPAGGVITWTLYGPASDGSAQCSTTKTLSPNTATVSGDNTAYGPVTYTTNHAGDIAGKYTFAASYPGEGPNTNAASSVTCAAAGQNNATGEQVIVSSSSVKTTPNVIGSTSITTAGSVTVSDSATVTVNGASTWSGTVAFYLCGPDDLTSQSTCATGGLLISSGNAVSNASPTTSSGNATVTKVGNYCWRGVFTSGTTGVPDATDSSATECFSITPVTPTLATQASGPTVVLGNPISDTATLSGTANRPGTPVINPTTAGGPAQGTITIKVFGPDSCTTSAHADFTVNVTNGDNGGVPYGPVSFTPTAIGVYVFVASYSGDSPNTNAQPGLTCANQPASEKVTVIGVATSSSKQGWLPNDRITLNSTAGSTLHGTLTVKLYYGAFTGTLASCAIATGSVLEYTEPDITVNSLTNSDTEHTTNGTFYVGTNPITGVAGGPDTDATHTYYWLIHYVDNSLTSPADRCESATITHNDG